MTEVSSKKAITTCMQYLRSKQPYFLKTIYACLVLVLLFGACNSKRDAHIIDLKWNKSYETDSLKRNLVGLKWALSFLGSDLALDSLVSGITVHNDVINIDAQASGFQDHAVTHLSTLHSVIKNSEEYKKKGNIDIGRYIALTIGSPNHYYKIAAVPSQLSELKSNYLFDSLTAYINNSSVSKIDREIQYSVQNKDHTRAYISAERDTITGKIQEFETVELMKNGLSKFALYDTLGNIKPVGDSKVTRAGKPAKCMWCHESGIQKLFRKQVDVSGYLSSTHFLDTLLRHNRALKMYQDSVWQAAFIKDRQTHTEMEIAYITFMEPSITQLANEWNISAKEVQNKVRHLTPHRHHEFDFLGDLYYRKDVDKLAPFEVIEVPHFIREGSKNKAINYLD